MKNTLTLFCLLFEFIAVVDITPCKEGCVCNNEQCLYCKQGYYRNDIGCEKCPLGCLYCTTEYDCDLCDSLYFLHNGSCFSCSQGCQGCKMIAGRLVCQSCLAGFYKNDDICKPCSHNCTSCSSPEFCQKCEDMFYVNAATLTCKQCPNNCELCKSSIRCEKCQSGYHGTYCQKSCSSGCKDRVCDEMTGVCNKGCRGNLTGDYCNSCKPGMYGTLCEQYCPPNCDECNSDTLCENCHSGYYGKMCELACPSGCLTDSCFQETGQCDVKFCKAGLGGPYCNECLVKEGERMCGKDCFERCLSCAPDKKCLNCIPGYFGTNCSLNCSSGCLYNECGLHNGWCHAGKCKTNFKNEYCNECVQGKYGKDCQENCPKDCYNNSCNRENGKCLSGCHLGMHGDRCENKCPRSCKTCVSENLCLECIDGYWGTKCQRCPMTCQKQQCYPDGSCQSCLPGLYGVFCNMSCSNTCLINACGRDGECFGCKPGYFDASCSQMCPKHCKNSKCTSTGLCIECANGYTGEKCDIELITNQSNKYQTTGNKCNINCLNETCFFQSEACDFGCKNGFYGQKCDKKCSDTCLNDTCDLLTGECIMDCAKSENDTACQKSNSVAGQRYSVMTISLISGGGMTGILTCLVLVICRLKKRRNITTTSANVDHNDGYEIPSGMALQRQDISMAKENLHGLLQQRPASQTQVKTIEAPYRHSAAVENETIYDLPIEDVSAVLVEESHGDNQNAYYITCI